MLLKVPALAPLLKARENMFFLYLQTNIKAVPENYHKNIFLYTWLSTDWVTSSNSASLISASFSEGKITFI